MNPAKIFKALKEKSKQFSELSAGEKQHFTNPLVTWESPLYPSTIKNTNWYLGLFSATAILAIYGFLSNSWTFSVAIVIAAGVYYYLNEQDVPIVQVSVSEFGILVGNFVYPFSEIKTFWIAYNPPYHKELRIVLKNEYKPEVVISIHAINPTELRSVLTKYLPEWEEREKSFSENLTHFLGL